NLIHLETTGRDTDIQTLLSLLPEEKVMRFEKYRSRGNVYFKALLDGEISATASPSLTADFGFDNTTLFHPDYRTRVENATLRGSFASPKVSDVAQARLALRNITGVLNSEQFEADFTIENFVDPKISLRFKGKLDAPSVFDFYPVEQVRYVSGTLDVDIAFDGKIGLLKDRSTAQKVSTL